MASSKAKKVRYFHLVSYASESSILQVLVQKVPQLRAYAYIYHDKDEGKTPHYHILLVTYHARSCDDVCRWFADCVDALGLHCNTLIEICYDINSSYDYLTHKNDLDKFQYSSDDIVSHNVDFFHCDSSVDTLSLAVDDLIKGVTLNECRKRYGRDFIIHYGHIKTLLVDIISECQCN